MDDHLTQEPLVGHRDESDLETSASQTQRCVVALVPAHNEAQLIVDTVTAIRSIDPIDRVIVIDDGSTDTTARLAEDAGAKVMRSMRNVGKGGALNAAVKWCEDADIVVLLDADLGQSASEASKLIEAVLDGRADMTIATFPPAGKAGFGLVKDMAARAIARTRSGFVAHAPLSGQRALTRTCLDATLPFASGYGAEVVLTVRALQAGFRVLEVETTMTHAATGRDLAGFVHRARQFIHVWWAIRSLKS